MKFVFLTAVVLVLLILAPSAMPSRLIEHSPRSRHSHGHGHRHNYEGHHRHHHTKSSHKDADDFKDVAANSRTSSLRELATTKEGKPSTIEVAGSRLPDCSNACGSCKPCKLVMVSYVCASLSEAESCPMAYKCMCRNKSYPVP